MSETPREQIHRALEAITDIYSITPAPPLAGTVCILDPRLRKRTLIARLVVPGLVPGIHVFLLGGQEVAGRDKSGHDEE